MDKKTDALPIFAGSPPVAEGLLTQRAILCLIDKEIEPYAKTLPPIPSIYIYDAAQMHGEIYHADGEIKNTKEIKMFNEKLKFFKKNNKTHDDIIESASVTSLMRYLLSSENEKIQNPDAYGKYFVNGKWKQYLQNIVTSKEKMQKILPGCMYYHLIRTKRFDDALLKWINLNKQSQVIIYGAGFDSRSMRFKNILNENEIFFYEIDLAAMLDFKKMLLWKII